MITFHNLKLNIFQHADGTADDALNGYGLSTDEKPTDNVPNATPFLEMNTGNVFIFDAENKKWHPN